MTKEINFKTSNESKSLTVYKDGNIAGKNNTAALVIVIEWRSQCRNIDFLYDGLETSGRVVDHDGHVAIGKCVCRHNLARLNN
jgi:hypothetical protein